MILKIKAVSGTIGYLSLANINSQNPRLNWMFFLEISLYRKKWENNCHSKGETRLCDFRLL